MPGAFLKGSQKNLRFSNEAARHGIGKLPQMWYHKLCRAVAAFIGSGTSMVLKEDAAALTEQAKEAS